MKAIEKLIKATEHMKATNAKIVTLEADLKQSRQRVERLEVAGDAMREALSAWQARAYFQSDVDAIKAWDKAKGKT